MPRPAAAADAHEKWRLLGERFRIGSPIAVLETVDRRIAYPAWKEVAGLLPELAVSSQAAPRAGASGSQGERLQNTRFYDDFGWVEGAEGVFNDALAFEDMRPVTSFYRKRCHRRVNRHLTGGRYLLDCASGPVQIPEYVSYSEGFEKRICVDLSFAGLLKAKERLGEHAICIVGDITALPLRDGCADNFVSAHTVYHVPAAEQAKAVAELHRVLARGGTGVIVYSWGSASPIFRASEKLRAWLERRGWLAPPAGVPQLKTDLGLYFHAHDYGWYRREIEGPYAARLRVWRSVHKEFLEWFARGEASARLLLWPLYAAEELMPRLFGRYGISPMFVLRKD